MFNGKPLSYLFFKQNTVEEIEVIFRLQITVINESWDANA